MPVADQLHQLQREGHVDATQLHVVSTFETPLPYSSYLRHPDLLPADTEQVTFYLELDDGYPLSSVGPPGTDFVASFEAVFDDPQAVQAVGEAGRFPSDAADRAVLLGFTTPYETFARSDRSLRNEYGIGAAEVVATPDDPPIGWNDPVDQGAVARFTEAWAAREGGDEG